MDLLFRLNIAKCVPIFSSYGSVLVYRNGCQGRRKEGGSGRRQCGGGGESSAGNGSLSHQCGRKRCGRQKGFQEGCGGQASCGSQSRRQGLADQSQPRRAVGRQWRQTQGAGGGHPAIGDTGRCGVAVAAESQRTGTPGAQPGAQECFHRLGDLGRERQHVLGGAGGAPEDFQQALHQHGKGRRGRRGAGGDAQPVVAVHGEGGEDQGQGESRHVLSGCRARHHGRHPLVPDVENHSAVREHLQGDAAPRHRIARIYPICHGCESCPHESFPAHGGRPFRCGHADQTMGPDPIWSSGNRPYEDADAAVWRSGSQGGDRAVYTHVGDAGLQRCADSPGLDDRQGDQRQSRGGGRDRKDP